MSIQFTDLVTYLTRTTGLVQGSAASYSWCIWFRPDADIVIPDYQTIIASETATQYQGIYGDSSTGFNLQVNNGSGLQDTVGTVLLKDHWYPIGYHRSGISHQFYISGTFAGGVTDNMAAVTFLNLFLGTDTFGSNRGTFAYFREWTSVLGPTQFNLESNSRVAVQTSQLVTDTPLTSNLLDLTSNHNDWTVVGTGYQFILDDPIPLHGTVVSDPIDLGTLPYSETIEVQPTNVEFVFNQWFKYTAVEPEVYIGGWFFGDLTHYRASYTIYSDAGITNYPPDNPISSVENRRFQMPVTAGDSYYFFVTPFILSNSLGHGSLIVDFLTGPNKRVPDGSPFINDDLEDFYSTIVSSVDGDDYNVLRFFPFVPTNSETGGDISQQNGKILIINDITAKIELYSSKLIQLLDTGITGTSNGVIRRLADGSAYYTSHGLVVNRVTKDGVVGSTTWTLTGTRITGMAPSNSEAILYVSTSTATGAPVKQWDLINSVFLTDLVAGIASYFVSDIMVLSDDSILVLYFKTSGGSNLKVIRYNAAGFILNTYDLGNPVTTPPGSGNIAFDFTDPDNYFQARVHHLTFDGSSKLLRVKLSDGTITGVTHVIYENGIYTPAETATPIAKFGVSSSCPFFLIRALTNPFSGIYKIVPEKRNDTLWIDVDAEETEDVKIPDPLARTALLGD